MNKNLTLKELRKSIDATQENVAWKCKVCREAVSLWERGLRKPDKKHIKTMARFFMVPVETVEAALAESQEAVKAENENEGDEKK